MHFKVICFAWSFLGIIHHFLESISLGKLLKDKVINKGFNIKRKSYSKSLILEGPETYFILCDEVGLQDVRPEISLMDFIYQTRLQDAGPEAQLICMYQRCQQVAGSEETTILWYWRIQQIFDCDLDFDFIYIVEFEETCLDTSRTRRSRRGRSRLLGEGRWMGWKLIRRRSIRRSTQITGCFVKLGRRTIVASPNISKWSSVEIVSGATVTIFLWWKVFRRDIHSLILRRETEARSRGVISQVIINIDLFTPSGIISIFRRSFKGISDTRQVNDVTSTLVDGHVGESNSRAARMHFGHKSNQIYIVYSHIGRSNLPSPTASPSLEKP